MFCHHAGLLLWHITSLRSLCCRPSDCAVGFWGGCWGTRIMTIGGRTNGKCGRWAWQCDPAVGNKENKWTVAQCSYMRRWFPAVWTQDLLFLLKRECPTVIIQVSASYNIKKSARVHFQFYIYIYSFAQMLIVLCHSFFFIIFFPSIFTSFLFYYNVTMFPVKLCLCYFCVE